MVENGGGVPRQFPEAGLSADSNAWTWTVARRELFTSPAWLEYWRTIVHPLNLLAQESGFAAHFRSLGFTGDAAFGTDRFSTRRSGAFTPGPTRGRRLPTASSASLSPCTLRSPPARSYRARHPCHDRSVRVSPRIDLAAPRTHRAAESAQHERRDARGALGRGPTLDDPLRSRIVAVAHVSDVNQAPDLFARLTSLPPGSISW